MDIYNSIIKQSSIIFFIIDEEGMVVDTNLYTMELMNMYDLNGREFLTLIDESSENEVKQCLSYGAINNIEVNLLSERGIICRANISLNRIDRYVTVLGTLQLDNIPIQKIDNSGIYKSIDTDYDMSDKDNKRQWQVKNLDPLTGLYNKEFFTHLFEAKYSSIVHRGGNIGVICFRIDNLDDIISNHGIEKGDRILAAFANVMLTNTRSTDYCIRHNERFLLLLTDTNKEAMEKIAKRVKKAAEENMSISLSSGWACTVDKQLEDKWDLISLAYENLSKL